MSKSKQQRKDVEQPSVDVDVLDRQYHDIGIPAVAAACRYQAVPEPQSESERAAANAV